MGRGARVGAALGLLSGTLLLTGCGFAGRDARLAMVRALDAALLPGGAARAYRVHIVEPWWGLWGVASAELDPVTPGAGRLVAKLGAVDGRWRLLAVEVPGRHGRVVWRITPLPRGGLVLATGRRTAGDARVSAAARLTASTLAPALRPGFWAEASIPVRLVEPAPYPYARIVGRRAYVTLPGPRGELYAVALVRARGRWAPYRVVRESLVDGLIVARRAGAIEIRVLDARRELSAVTVWATVSPSTQIFDPLTMGRPDGAGTYLIPGRYVRAGGRWEGADRIQADTLTAADVQVNGIVARIEAGAIVLHRRGQNGLFRGVRRIRITDETHVLALGTGAQGSGLLAPGESVAASGVLSPDGTLTARWLWIVSTSPLVPPVST